MFEEGEYIFLVSTVGKAEGNRLKLTYGIFVLNIKGKMQTSLQQTLEGFWRHHPSEMCLN